MLDVEPDSTGGAVEFNLVFRGPPRSHLTVGIWRMNESGPNSALAAPALPLDESGEHRFPLHGGWPDGLYVALLNPASTPPASVPPVDLRAAHPFELSGGTAKIPSSPDAAIEAALAAQAAFREREIRADGFTGQNRFALHVVVEGCYLDYAQSFEGGRLQPLTNRLGPDSVVTVVNALLPSGLSFASDTLRETYSRSHPLCLVTFVNVQAPGVAEAATAVQARLNRVLGALAEDRNASPQVLAYLSESPAREYSLSFPGHAYHGNLVAGFGPGVTGLLDLIETAAESDPWIDFALRLMRSARLQTNSEMQLFQAWSLIEAAAKRTVLSDRSKPVQSRDLGRVIIYLRDHVGRNRLAAVMLTDTPDFYDQVRVLYDGRNRIAHEGGLAAPGSRPPAADAFKLAWTAKDWAAEVLRYEVRRAAS
jgi:hypothetical protein